MGRKRTLFGRHSLHSSESLLLVLGAFMSRHWKAKELSFAVRKRLSLSKFSHFTSGEVPIGHRAQFSIFSFMSKTCVCVEPAMHPHSIGVQELHTTAKVIVCGVQQCKAWKSLTSFNEVFATR